MWEVIVNEVTEDGPDKPKRAIERFRQVVDSLDLQRVIEAVNHVKRVRKAREQKT